MNTSNNDNHEISAGYIISQTMFFISENFRTLFTYALMIGIVSTMGTVAVKLAGASVLRGIFISIINVYVGIITTIMMIKVIDCTFNNEEFNIGGLLEFANSRFWKVLGIGILAGLCIVIPTVVVALIYVYSHSIVFNIIFGILLSIPGVYVLALFMFIRIMPVVEDLDQQTVGLSDCVAVVKHNIKTVVALTLFSILVGVPIYVVTFIGTRFNLNPVMITSISAVLSMVITPLIVSVDYIAYRNIKAKMDDETRALEGSVV